MVSNALQNQPLAVLRPLSHLRHTNRHSRPRAISSPRTPIRGVISTWSSATATPVSTNSSALAVRSMPFCVRAIPNAWQSFPGPSVRLRSEHAERGGCA